MADLKALAGKMVGPLPLGVWVALVAGGLFIAYRRYQANTSDTNDTSNVVTYPVDPNYPTTVPGGYLTDADSGNDTGSGDIPSTGIEPPTDNAIDTNEEWAQKAIDYLVKQGGDPAVASQAITEYLAGSVPNRASHWGFIRAAISAVGAPPYPTEQVNQPVPQEPDKGWYHTNVSTPAYSRGGKSRGYKVKRGHNVYVVSWVHHIETGWFGGTNYGNYYKRRALSKGKAK